MSPQEETLRNAALAESKMSRATSRRLFAGRVIAASLTLPGVLAGFGLLSPPAHVQVVLGALGLAAAGALAAWLLFRHDRSGLSMPLATVLVATALVLPEAAVDAFLSGGQIPTDHGVLAPNNWAASGGSLTLMLGLAWPLLIIGSWLRRRSGGVDLGGRFGFDLTILLLVALYAFVIFIKANIGMTDVLVVLMLSCFYVWKGRWRRTETRPEAPSPAPVKARTFTVVITMLVAGYVVLATIVASKGLASGLVALGTGSDADVYSLALVVAPWSAKAPWLVAFAVLAWRMSVERPAATLVTAHMLFWVATLVVLPLAVVGWQAAQGPVSPLYLDPNQQSVLLLAASQSVFFITLVLARATSWRSGIALFVPAALLWPGLHLAPLDPADAREVIAVTYLVASTGILVAGRAFAGRRSGRADGSEGAADAYVVAPDGARGIEVMARRRDA